MFVVTEDWIEQNKTKGGSWNKQQLAQLGVDWPPPTGWKARAVGRKLSDGERTTFEAHSGRGSAAMNAEKTEEKVLDIHEFDDLISDYQEACLHGGSLVRTEARRALKEAYRAALRAAGKSDR